MADKEELVTLDPERQEQWKEIAAVNQKRFPRIEERDVIALVNAAWPPTIFLHEDENTTDIVIRFSSSSRHLSADHQRIYFTESRTLANIFDEAISKPRESGESALRSELMVQGYRAYKRAWLYLFQSMWRNQTHPAHNPPEWFRLVEKAFEQRRSPGRPKNVPQDQIRVRFDRLLKHTQKLRGTIAQYLKDKASQNRGHRSDIVRTFWRDISKISGGQLILGGEAFIKIPYGKQDKPASLADPSTWNARQLAIALLAIETEQDYHTIERKLAERRRNKVLTRP